MVVRNNEEEVSQAFSMRLIGALLVVLSSLEFAVGAATYGSLGNVHLGAWWAAICTFIAGICGCMSSSRNIVLLGFVFSLFGFLIALVGAILDGLSTGSFAAEKACISAEDDTIYGQQDQQENLEICTRVGGYRSGYNSSSYNETQYYNDNYYNHTDSNVWYSDFETTYYSYDCICTDNSLCYGYTLGTLSDCGEILTTYTSLLSGSTAIVTLLCVICFIYTILTCISFTSKPYDSLMPSESPNIVEPIETLELSVQSAVGVEPEAGLQHQPSQLQVTPKPQSPTQYPPTPAPYWRWGTKL